MITNKKRFLVGFALLLLTGVLLVVLGDIPRFLDETISGSLRTSVLRTAKIAIPLKDRMLGRTITDKLDRLQTTGACQFCDLTNADLEGIDLHGADLRRTDLSGANLTGADLRQAKLTWANLTDANLTGIDLTAVNLAGVNLSGANLTGVNLTGAELYEANLNGADLKGADLIRAELFGANLNGANLERANLEGANLGEVELEGVNLSGANLRRADLSGADLSEVNLSRADLSAANLSEANLRGASLGGANLRGLDLTTVNLERVNMSGADLRGADLSSANLTGVNLSFADLRGADLERANLRGVNLVGADLSDTNLVETILSSANLNGANLNRAFIFFADIVDAVIEKEDLDQALLCYTKTADNTVSECDLSGGNLRGIDLRGANLSGVNLSGANLSRADLSGADLSEVNLSRADLSAANLSGANLSEANLSGANLSKVELFNGNLIAANMSGADLTGANLGRASLVNTNLVRATLTGAYLYGTRLVEADLSEVNLIGARLSGVDLTGANLRGANLGGVDLEKIGGHLGKNFIEIKENTNYREVTSFDLSGDVHYLTTKSGILYELNNEELTIGLDLRNNPRFTTEEVALGLMSVASNNGLIYISYTIRGDDIYQYYLVVEEYSKTFDKIRTILQIGLPTDDHNSGTLVFDRHGKLYVSVGDGGTKGDPERYAQDLKSLKGKILRFDVSRTNLEPEIVAYGLRNAWKISIDSKNRMFVGDCGWNTVESVYLIDDLYPTTPYNLGWPVFEGTERISEEGHPPFNKGDPLMLHNILAPIYEYRHYTGVGICVIGGFFLDGPEVYLFGDVLGNLRLLKEQQDGKWREIYSQQGPDIWSFGYDQKTKKLYTSGSKSFELIMPSEQINFLPQVTLCRTTMPNGTINNSDC